METDSYENEFTCISIWFLVPGDKIEKGKKKKKARGGEKKQSKVN